MKIKSIVGSIAIILGALTFVSAPAHAGDCSAEDPCHTYAVVDNAGAVINIIVCQPSVCGSGMFGGMKVVPQVAANPVTHQNQGGYLSNPGSAPVMESNGRFTVTNDSPVVSQNVVKEESKTVVVESIIGAGTQKSFTFDDTVAKPNGVPEMTQEPIKNSTSATLSATEFSDSTLTTVIDQETITFQERQTEQFVQSTVKSRGLNRIFSNWLWFRNSLSYWFI